MNSSPDHPSSEAIDHAAAAWVMRRDRGLTANEQDEFSQWLAADPRHGEAVALHRWGWDELDRLTGLQTSLRAVADPDLLAPRKSEMRGKAKVLRWLVPPVLAAAAAVTVALILRDPPAAASAPGPAVVSRALATPCERRELEDGSVVHLNRGAAVHVAFSAAERRIDIERGEANFTVAKNPDRPFIVVVNGVEVRAVGTVFNVRLSGSDVEVLVTEGRVQVNRPAAGAFTTAPLLLSAGDYAVVRRDRAAAPQVTALSPVQIAVRLAWQPTLLDFNDSALAEIVAEFNRRNPVELVLGDPALGALKLSATFRSDNVEGFVHLMESDFGMRAEWRSEREVALFRAR